MLGKWNDDMQEYEFALYWQYLKKTHSKWVKDLNISPETLKILGKFHFFFSYLDSFYFFFCSDCCGQNFQNYVE